MKKLVLFSLYLLVITFLRAQDTVYFCDFDHPSDTAGWHLENGFQSNRWTISIDSISGDGSLYVSNNATTVNYYDNRTGSLVYAYQRLALSRGVYRFSYDWRCAGERNYDYMRVFLVPDSVTLVAGSMPDGVTGRIFISGTPDGWTALDDGTALYQLTQPAVWYNYECERAVSTTDTYKLLFVWNNDASQGTQPPASVDNVVVDYPACPTPVWPYVDNLTPTSFDLHWTDLSRGNATHWIVEIDSATQTLGQGRRFDSYDTVISFTGLQPATDYTVHVWAVCGLDTLDSALSTTVRTPCFPITRLPYRQDFSSLSNNSTEVPCWTRVGSSYYVYVGVMGSDRDYLYWYGGGYIVLPGIDIDSVAVEGVQLSFYAQRSGTFEVGLVANPADMEGFVVVDTVRVDTPEPDWERVVVEFSNSQFSIFNSLPAYIALRSVGEEQCRINISNVEIVPVSACQQLRSLSVSHVGITSARLEWEVVETSLYAPDSFEVRVEHVGEFPQAWVLGGIERHFQLTGLTPHADYRVLVRVRCENDSLSGWDSVGFATLPLPCLQPDSTTTDTVVVGTETNQVSGVPVKHDWFNSLCQSIYTASELHSMGMTEGMVVGMDYAFTPCPYNHSFSIYMKRSGRTIYGDNYMVGVGEDDLVYGPALHATGTSGTVHYEFDNPFWWDGESSVVVTTVMSKHQGDWHPSSFYGYSTQTTGWPKTLFRYSSTPFTAAGLASGSGTSSNYRPSVTFYTMPCGEAVACMPPTAWVDSVGADAALVAWTPGLHETGWRVLYREWADTTHTGTDTSNTVVDSPWTLADTHVAANSYRLTSLLPAHRYEVRVEHLCGGDTLWDEVEFLTLCAAHDTLPLVEDFEDFVAPNDVDGATELCWYRATTGTHYYVPAPYVSADYAYSGEQSLRLRSSSSRGKTYIVLPAMGMDLSFVQLSFLTYSTADYRLKVGVMTDPTLPSTFAEVEVVSPTVLGQWEVVEAPLEDYTGSGRYIALMIEGMIGGSQPQDVCLDDLRVDYIPSCPRPRSVTVESVTQTSAILGWRGPNAIGYEVEYGPAGFAHGTGTVATSPSDSVMLTGLSHSTYYDVYVRSLCPESGSVLVGDTSEWSFVTTFSTACGMIGQLPYTQTFVNRHGVGNRQPACWECGSSYVGFVPSIVGAIDNMGLEIGGALCMPSQHTYRSFAMLPAIDTAIHPIHTLQVMVKAWGDTTGRNYAGTGRGLRELIVGVCPTTDPFVSFTPVDTLILSEVPTVYEVPLSAAVGAGNRIVFVSANLDGINERRIRYLDSVVVDSLPSCPRPYALHAVTVTGTTATVTWSCRDTVSQWQVEYMPHGAALGTGTRIIANTSTLTLVGLSPSTFYDFYVRTLCGTNDTSQWCYACGSFTTSQVPATVPYYYTFDTLSEWNSWQKLSNSQACWHRGMADGQPAPSMYLSVDSGSTRSTLVGSNVNAVCYRDIDFGSLDTAYILSFRASVGGGSAGSSHYDGLAVFLTDPTVPPATSSYIPYQSPWGHRDSLDLLVNIRNANYWVGYSFAIDSLTGVHRLVFFWYNCPSPNAYNYTFTGQPAAVDNVNIGYDPCPRPTHVHLTSLSATTAAIAWRGSEYDDYRVELLSSENLRLSVDTAHTNSIQFTGLTPATTYMVYIDHLCTSASSVQTVVYTFSTDVCADGISDTIGSVSAYSSRYEVPLNTIYPYSYTQQLVLASELHGAGEISSINFRYTGSQPMTAKTNCTIYMGHTTLSSFASVSDFVLPENLQPVYVGSLNCIRGWNRFYLDSPFAYNGSDNLVVAIGDNSGRTHNANYRFASAATTHSTTLSYYGNSGLDFSTNASLRAFEGNKNLYNYRSVMSLDFCPPNPCPPPVLLPAEVHVDSVVLRWRRQTTLDDTASGRYLLGYRLRSDNRWIEDNIPVTDTFYTIDRLLYFDTDYVYHVRQYCDPSPGQLDGGISNWSFGTFNTAIIPCRPPARLTVTEVTNHAVRLSWIPDGNNICYRVRLWGGGFDTLLTTYIAGCRIGGLNPNSHYYVAVQVVCEYHDNPSRWSDTVSFLTDFCPDVTGFSALEVYGNSVLLDWDDDGQAVAWQIEWGLQGFDHGTGVLVAADHHPFLLTGLTGETTYDIVVRAVCGNDYYSEGWSPRLTLTTAYSGIDQDEFSILNSQYSLSPNPTTGDVLLTLPVGIGALRVEVVDMTGRKCLNVLIPDCLSAGASNTQPIKQSNNQAILVTLPTSQLPAGAYYVRLTSDSLNTTKKLLKVEN